jgi:hypothetical protein
MPSNDCVMDVVDVNADLDADKDDVLYWWYDEHGVNDTRLLVDDRFAFSFSSV